MPTRGVLWTLLIICCCLPMAACRPADRNEVILSWATNPHLIRTDAIRAYERQNPGVRIELRPMSEPRQFFLQCLYGEAPDVITFFTPDTFQAFARNGQLLPLARKPYTPWPFYAGLKDYCFRRGDDTLMALPQVAYPYVLYYNKDLVAPDTALALETWEDLLAVALPRLTDPPPKCKKIFALDIQSDQVWFTTWYQQRGGRFFSRDGRLILDRNLAIETLDAMSAWRNRPGLIPAPADRLNLPSHGASQGVLGNLFLQGRAMFFWSGSWKIHNLMNQEQVDWGVRLLPAGPASDLTLLGGNSFGVSARSRHPEAAKHFVAFLGSMASQGRLAAHHLYLPARKDCPVPEACRVLKAQARRARCPAYSPGINETLRKEIFKQALSAHRLGKIDAARAVDLLTEALGTGRVVQHDT